jgi:hypothetical protein
MINKELDKKLKSDSKFIPFNDKFDYDYVKNYLNNKKNDNIDLELTAKALTTNIFNLYYVGLKNSFNSMIESTLLSNETIAEILIFLTNRDYFVLTEKVYDSISKKDHIHFEEISNFSIQSPIPELGNFNAQSAIEAGLDSLNITLNLLNKFDNTSINTQIVSEHVDNWFRLLGFTSIYTVIKFSYDASIWEEYNIRYLKNDAELHIHSFDNELSIINAVGEHRLETNIYAAKQIALSNYSKNGDFTKIIANKLYKNRKPKRLKVVGINNNYLYYKLADGVEKESVIRELMLFAELTAYYEFIGDEQLPNFDNLSLHDIITLFSEIQHLLANAIELKKEESDDILQSFNLFKIYIRHKDLIDYLLAKTKYSNNQIKETIKLLSHESGNYNIWERPIISRSNVLIPIFLPITSPNTLRLIDYWLEQGGFDLETRGKLFEKHIKKLIEKLINKKGYYVNILNKNEFRNEKNDTEEIDLIIELKNIIVIAEVKCVKYPFDPRDYHNMFKRLKDGAIQVKRKTDFIKKNYYSFQKDFNDLSKEIVSIVITNYPIYSGYLIENVPVIDLLLLENYFNGYLNMSVMGNTGKNIELFDRKEPIEYYSNEIEFSNNIGDFLFDPIPIRELKKNVYISKKQISLPNSKPKITMDYSLFKNSIVI